MERKEQNYSFCVCVDVHFVECYHGGRLEGAFTAVRICFPGAMFRLYIVVLQYAEHKLPVSVIYI